ncbi:MAG: PfkB family carbohydrate kinase [bacterium]|nr:PfkB family carbohydrate kinase [bacterium]
MKPLKPIKKSAIKRVIKEASGLQNQFSKKIKTVTALHEILGQPPRAKKVIMCHGTFDIVHPGHIRQLIYAKSKGDILLVSLTIDKHISKGPLRPYVPDKLRALNMAALEIVDYVLVDNNPTPLENISLLKPDFFVKGFEYSIDGIHPRTKEEIDSLAKYGGKFLFSPGDIVYSSTKLLMGHKPNLAVDHLLTLMEAEGVTFDNLRTTVKNFNKAKILVVGDTIVDKYSRTTVVGISQKSPALQVHLNEFETYVGGSGIVAKHFCAMGAQVGLITIMGNDDAGRLAKKDIKSFGVKLNAMVDNIRPTTVKERFMTDGDLVLFQVDTGDNSPLSYALVDKICRHISRTQSDAVVCSDFRHGIFNKESIKKIVEAIPDKTLKVGDSQVSDRWGNILELQNFDLLAPNEREARFSLGDQETGIRPLAQKLYNAAKCRFLILKLGKDGIMTYRSPGMETREYFYLDSFAQNVTDPIGAGDALLAASVLGLIISKNIVQASILGNLSAAVECSRMGNIPISKNDLFDALDNLEQRAKFLKKPAKKRRFQKNKIGS